MAEEHPKIEFPCRYPIKVIGFADEGFREFVLEVMNRHAEGVTDEDVRLRDSRDGKFVSVTVAITATGQPQLEAIFTDLKQSDRVQIVL